MALLRNQGLSSSGKCFTPFPKAGSTTKPVFPVWYWQGGAHKRTLTTSDTGGGIAAGAVHGGRVVRAPVNFVVSLWTCEHKRQNTEKKNFFNGKVEEELLKYCSPPPEGAQHCWYLHAPSNLFISSDFGRVITVNFPSARSKTLTSISVITQNAALGAEIQFAFLAHCPPESCPKHLFVIKRYRRLWLR